MEETYSMQLRALSDALKEVSNYPVTKLQACFLVIFALKVYLS